MRSVVPSESETVPVPDHDPSKPAKGPDCAWLADIDNISAAPTAAALMACPNKPETESFISNFPVQIDAVLRDMSRRIEGLVSPRWLRFMSKVQMSAARGFANSANRPSPSR